MLLDVHSKDLDTGEFVDLDDVVFATLGTATPTVTDGVVTYTALPATLTAEGAAGFAGFYEAGTELDPVTVTIAVDGATLPPPGAGSGTGTGTGTGSSNTPTTPASLAQTGFPLVPMIALGALLLLAGAGLMRARQRA